MAEFETYTCENCGDDFKAHPSANAASKRLCSPRCETDHAGN